MCRAVLYVSGCGLLNLLQDRDFTVFLLFSDYFTKLMVALLLRQDPQLQHGVENLIDRRGASREARVGVSMIIGRYLRRK